MSHNAPSFESLNEQQLRELARSLMNELTSKNQALSLQKLTIDKLKQGNRRHWQIFQLPDRHRFGTWGPEQHTEAAEVTTRIIQLRKDERSS